MLPENVQLLAVTAGTSHDDVIPTSDLCASAATLRCRQSKRTSQGPACRSCFGFIADIS